MARTDPSAFLPGGGFDWWWRAATLVMGFLSSQQPANAKPGI